MEIVLSRMRQQQWQNGELTVNATTVASKNPLRFGSSMIKILIYVYDNLLQTWPKGFCVHITGHIRQCQQPPILDPSFCKS